jgi:spore maturation protein CgeB
MQRHGHLITTFNTHTYQSSGSRLSRSIGSRFNVGPHVSKLNQDLIAKLQNLNKVNLIWIDKGNWIQPTTIKKLKTALQVQVIHFTPDAAFKSNFSHLFKASLPLYDCCLTTKPFELDDYYAHNAKHVHLIHQAFEKTRFYPRPKVKAYESDVCFIGHFEIHYARRLKAVAKTGVRLAIWGPGWKRYSKLTKWCRTFIKGDGIWGDEYPQALCSAKICLGLLSKKIPEKSTTRTFEIPACGCFLLAERTTEHSSFFIEGKEAVYASSDTELTNKVIYYLDHPQERIKIAAAGLLRSTISNYHNDANIQQIFKNIVNEKTAQ